MAGAKPTRIKAFFVDEVTFECCPNPSHDWCEQAPAPRLVADREESPYRRTRLVGALDAMTGHVMVLQNNHNSAEIFSRFLCQVDAAYPDAEALYVIWDNWPVHHSEIAKATLAQLPRLKVVTLPTYAPWLNPIEKLWRKFRQELDYLHSLAHDWKAWRAQVKQFFKQFARPSPDVLRLLACLARGSWPEPSMERDFLLWLLKLIITRTGSGPWWQ